MTMEGALGAGEAAMLLMCSLSTGTCVIILEGFEKDGKLNTLTAMFNQKCLLTFLLAKPSLQTSQTVTSTLVTKLSG